jgi:DNA-binding transcriptional LysR family regulator
MLPWDDLQSFLAIARLGTLSAAARSLGVMQTTMGRRLAGMEARAGARLLARTPSGYVLTPAGEAILGNVERIEAEALAVERRITGRDIRLEGAVRVTTVEILAVELLTPAFARLAQEHPGIVLEVATDARSLNLSRREADIALRLARLTQNDLAVRRVGSLGFGIYASAAYLDRHGMPDFVGGAPGHGTILNLAEDMGLPEMTWFSDMTREAQPAVRHNNRYGQRAAAEAGMGLAVLSRFMGDATGLTRLATPVPPPVREILLAVHNDIRHTPRIRAVTDTIAASVRAQADRLAPDDA